MDKLDKYIKDHRSEFDDQEPAIDLWSRIEADLPSPKDFTWIWKVAAVIFFCTSLYLSLDKFSQSSEENLVAQKETISDDFGDVESYYFQIISEKRDLIYEYDTGEAPIQVDFEQDLQKLDAMYQVLKEELKANPSKKVVDALILNLLVRIDVLNEKIEELEGDDDAPNRDEANKEEVEI
ncbi:hypothetical protein [Fulvivirga lutea]|uniref:Anti-sigma factor n=1 Tax=Fulvivirga lutea TaxID=2810512 RepID=A0A974ZZU7_9BACT|nr:hypothetical protein [Fulvivirga lutea]QSE96146.1 hypothetical protein JR347_11025 [Fulvivirga lutea]